MINSPQTFYSRGNTYRLNASATTQEVKLNGKDISKYLASPNGCLVGWYDISKNSGRETQNANGTMILNVINNKFRLDILTRYLTSSEMVDFFSEIVKSPKLTVEFYNPFTGQTKTINAYRGDRSAKPYMPYQSEFLYEGTSIALIEL